MTEGERKTRQLTEEELAKIAATGMPPGSEPPQKSYSSTVGALKQTSSLRRPVYHFRSAPVSPQRKEKPS
jgi:hypothetical protein